MANTHSREPNRNGDGEGLRDDDTRRKADDRDDARARARFATQRGGNDPAADAGDYEVGGGSGDWRQYAPGGSWYGREDFEDGRRRDTGFDDGASRGPYAGKGPKGYRRSDAQITEEASQRLYRDGQVDAGDIEVSCKEAVLTLKGTVHDRRMKRLAEDCVASVFGVADVVNELRIRNPSP